MDLIAAISALELPSLQRPVKLEGDFMVVGDVHVPFADWRMCQRVAAVARRYLPAPRKLIINGDFFDMGNFSTWAAVIQTPTWAQERESARLLMAEWLGTFAEIYMVMGNHERRLQKFTEGAFDDVDILGLIRAPEQVHLSGYGWCEVVSGGQLWRVTHPRNYSINQLVVGDQLALKFGCHVLLAHEHHLSAGWDRYKRHLVVNGGCLVDPAKLAYVQLDDSKSAGMARGFVMLKNGTPYLFGEAPFTDWGWYE